MGAAVIEAIQSGLGLIKTLAEEFLNGFETLVWVAPTGSDTVGHLTAIGTFGFVMLGVAVSFSVIKLVMNMLRGNTGI